MKLSVPGATLHWQETGDGPTLLILQGGDGDADASALLAAQLGGYRVVTYDRRGLSRSALTEPGVVELPTHTADALAVLEAATDEPALVFGTSIGAMIGLDLMVRAPQAVRRLVAHEAPLTQLLPREEGEAIERVRDEIDALYRAQGVMPAMRRFLTGAGVNVFDREPDVGMAALHPGRLQNLKFFLENDARVIRHFRLDVAALKPSRERIVIAAAEGSRGMWLHRCTELLAAELGVAVVDFPGDHAGYVARPRAFAAKLREALG